jgi:hypothetical protein
MLQDKYLIGQELGRGAYGQVYKAIDQQNGQVVAIKQVSLERIGEDAVGSLLLEIDLLKNLNHRNIVTYLGSYRTPTALCIILEYVAALEPRRMRLADVLVTASALERVVDLIRCAAWLSINHGLSGNDAGTWKTAPSPRYSSHPSSERSQRAWWPFTSRRCWRDCSTFTSRASSITTSRAPTSSPPRR